MPTKWSRVIISRTDPLNKNDHCHSLWQRTKKSIESPYRIHEFNSLHAMPICDKIFVLTYCQLGRWNPVLLKSLSKYTNSFQPFKMSSTKFYSEFYVFRLISSSVCFTKLTVPLMNLNIATISTVPPYGIGHITLTASTEITRLVYPVI